MQSPTQLQLRELTPNDKAAFLHGLTFWHGEDPVWYSFCWHEGMSFSEMLEILDKEKRGVDLLPGRVPHTMLYAFYEDQIVGRLSVRHHLNEQLSKRGGHIGYAVAPAFRKKGYATQIVQQGLEYCRLLGLTELLVTCSDENTPSIKLIEKFGGVLLEKPWDEQQEEFLRKYTIKINKN